MSSLTSTRARYHTVTNGNPENVDLREPYLCAERLTLRHNEREWIACHGIPTIAVRDTTATLADALAEAVNTDWPINIRDDNAQDRLAIRQDQPVNPSKCY